MKKEYKVAFARSKKAIDIGDQLVIDYSNQQTDETTARIFYEIWDDKEVKWDSYDLVIIRSCWDYHLRIAAFRDWLRILDEKNVSVGNKEFLTWNMNKKYLQDLHKRGIRIPYCWFIEKKDHGWNLSSLDSSIESAHKDGKDLALSLQNFINQDVKQVVLKPSVSASAFKTSLISSHELSEVLQTTLDANNIDGWIVQEFVEGVKEEGEWSLIYFNGQYSHSVLKTAAKGDFRVQTGDQFIQTADSQLLAMGDQVIQSLPSKPLYARVDVVKSFKQNEYFLMELELIEPGLFLDNVSDARTMFYDSILKHVSNK